ncbi:MAG: hypothetical protein AAB535_00245 [Patescibacteria group bacterium]
MFKKYFPFILIYSIVIFLYYPVLFTYFSHDDFFHFKVSITDRGLGEIIKLFEFYPFDSRGIAFYRPIFREFLYNNFYYLFGLNPLPFRVFQFLIHFVNIYLVFRLVQKIYKNKIVSFFTSFFFGICTANVASFYYLAGGIQVQGATMFILSTLILFEKYPVLSFITFLGAISSHELAATVPILLIGLILIKHKFKDGLKQIWILWPYFIVVGIYLYINLKIIGYSTSETQYSPVLNPKTTINTLAWYGGWALGLPETLIDFVGPGFKLNPSLMRFWGNYYKIIFPSFFASATLIVFYLIQSALSKSRIFKDKRFWFFIIWFLIILLPVLFLPQHKSTYYLYPALPAFWAVLGIISYKMSRILFVILVISLVSLSTSSAILGRSTYWASSRGKLAEKIINSVKLKYPTLPVGSGVYFINDSTYPFVAQDWKGTSKQASYALNGEDGLQLVYKDKLLRVFYEDSGGIPDEFPIDKIKPIVAIY